MSGCNLPDSGSPCRIAIVEEQQAIIELLQTALSGAGFEVSVAETSGLGAALADLASVDLVLLDVEMMKFDGWQLLHELRSAPSSVSIPVIVASATWTRAGLRNLPPGGPVKFCRKPFDVAELVALAQRMDSASRAGRVRSGAIATIAT